ncbi:tail fiber protein [Escherichia phage vB_EcoM-VpaE1]|uniref:Tail fiber protein n=1 Tax=Escherichia phage vB_EcoM-VpaE1 TaxID=1555238 RepID=A0A0A0RLH0_9CAUD|nr:tail fiber protein [Escherichia phage vB_EcoM-VpaE1]AIW02335.1 tail fiber protein [Escherichia phage vB_EcoM-VpaE1]
MADYNLSELNSIDTIRSDDLLHVRVKKRPEMLGDEDRRMTYQDLLASFKLERFVQIAGSNMTGDLGIVKLLYGGKAVFDPTGSSEINIGDVLKTFKINANGLRLTITDASRSATVYHTLNKPSPNELGMRTNEENDARYARLAVTNNFNIRQAIVVDGEQLTLKKATNAGASYIQGRNANNQQTWYVGQGNANNTNVYLYNHATGSMLTLDATASFNKTLRVMGQVQPSDFSNLDARYFTQTVANQRFAQLTANNTFRGVNTFNQILSIETNSAALRLKNTVANGALYIKGESNDGSSKWYVGNGDNTPAVLIHNYTYGSNLRLDNGYVEVNKQLKVVGQVQPSDWTNIDSRYIPAGTLSNLAKLNVSNTFTNVQTIVSDNEGLVLRSLTQGQPQYIRGVDTANVSRWWLGAGSANSNVVTLSNSFSGTQISLEPTLVSMNKNLYINGQVQPQDWSNLDARYFVKTKLLDQSLMTVTVNNLEDHPAFNLGYSGFVRNNGVTDGLRDLAIHVAHSSKTAAYARGISFSYGSMGLGVFTYAYDDEGEYAGEAQLYTTDFKPTPSDIGAYTKAETDQKIAQAVSDSTDLNKIYPVGIVTWFNSNVDPNTALPGLTWTYLNNGVGRTIRIAAANGSDVATTGGSDSVTLSVGNLPSHTHSFSATTSSFDYGTKGTNTTGGHTHSGSGSTSTNGEHSHYIEAWNGTGRGGDKMSSYAVSYRTGGSNTNAAGNHSHTFSFGTSGAGDHSHSVGIGAHSHTVSGNTGGTGSGSAFSVTNQFYKLMAWVRTA